MMLIEENYPSKAPTNVDRNFAIDKKRNIFLDNELLGCIT